jgi:hypothetical protein
MISNILLLEWEMFSSVNSIDGQVDCQQDAKTFLIMRGSQAECWTDELLESYLSDLEKAREEGKNLMTEKYARMMETSLPDDYAALADRLPEVSDEIASLIEEIVSAQIVWKLDSVEKYPKLAQRGRPLYTKEDSYYFGTSFETYLRCELKTLSPDSVKLYHKMVMDMRETGSSLEEEHLLGIITKYGYPSRPFCK